MSIHKRNYPKVTLKGAANLRFAGEVRNGDLLALSPTGVQIECRHQLVEELARIKSESGLYPAFELEFGLPARRSRKKQVKSTCNVASCRRLSQDCYYLGLNFVELSESDEKKVSAYLSQAA